MSSVKHVPRKRVSLQPFRDPRLIGIDNNDVIIIPKNKIKELKEKFETFKIFFNLGYLTKNTLYDKSGNFTLKKDHFPALKYTYFKGPEGTNVHNNTAEFISGDILFGLLPNVIFNGYIPEEYRRILEDVLMAKRRGIFNDPPVARPITYRPDPSRATLRRMAQDSNNNNNNNYNNNLNNNLNNNYNNNTKKAKAAVKRRHHERTKMTKNRYSNERKRFLKRGPKTRKNNKTR